MNINNESIVEAENNSIIDIKNAYNNENKNTNEINNDNNNYKKSFKTLLLEYLSANNSSENEIYQELISVLTDIYFLNSILHNRVIEYIKHYFQENLFTCYNILKNIDYNGSILNYQGIELLCTIECDFLMEKKDSNASCL